jgi:hypothetical protein
MKEVKDGTLQVVLASSDKEEGKGKREIQRVEVRC